MKEWDGIGVILARWEMNACPLFAYKRVDMSLLEMPSHMQLPCVGLRDVCEYCQVKGMFALLQIHLRILCQRMSMCMCVRARSS